VLDLFAHFGIRLTVAVVPYSHDGKDFTPLQIRDVPHLADAHQTGKIEVALHGYRHKANSRGQDGLPSEFRGVPLADQLDFIRQGKNVLEVAFATRMNGFVPPWNTYDVVTLRTVSQLGFSYLSSGIGDGKVGQYPVVIPKTSSMHVDQAKQSVASALVYRHCSPVVVFVFHPDNFVEFRYPPGLGEKAPYLSLSKLEEILRLIKVHHDKIATVTLFELAQELSRCSRMWCTHDFNRIGKLSYRVRQRLPTGFLSTHSKWKLIYGIAGAAG
jgi:peptidoglycan/xylan/chitin deacetylase (PgdA/CDA1 family)